MSLTYCNLQRTLISLISDLLFLIFDRQSSDASSPSKQSPEVSVKTKGTPECAANNLLRPVSDVVPRSPADEGDGLRTLPKQLAISYSGCGFLGTYHFGVMICFQRNAQVSQFLTPKASTFTPGSPLKSHTLRRLFCRLIDCNTDGPCTWLTGGWIASNVWGELFKGCTLYTHKFRWLTSSIDSHSVLFRQAFS